MNGLDKILDEIKMESDEVSASIIKEAQDKASEIARQARQKGEEAVKRIDGDTKQKCDDILARGGRLRSFIKGRKRSRQSRT